jgi:predicted metalloprotease with PDZ domain
MYQTYYKTKKRGYTDVEFKMGFEKFAGKNLNDFYKKYVYGLAPVDYDQYLGYAGYKLTDEQAASNDPTLGIAIGNNNGKKIVTAVLRGGAAWVDGINVDDELTAIDGVPLANPADMFAGKKPGDHINVTVMRDGLPLTLPVTLLRNNRVNFKVEALPNPTAQQLVVQKKWLAL